jgi:hypothetical protein
MTEPRAFPEVLLSLEWSRSAESGKILNDLGFSRRDRPTDPAARMTAFIPWLAIELLVEAAAQLGLSPIPERDEPTPELYRGYGWYLLAVVTCLWKRLAEDGFHVDLNQAAMHVLTLLYMRCPEEVFGREASVVNNRFVGELVPSDRFQGYLRQLELPVEAYVAAREGRWSPEERGQIVAAAATLLQGLLQALEVRKS